MGCIVFGASAVLYSVLTAYELGILKLLPMSLHLILEGISGILLAASPLLLGFSDRVFRPLVLFSFFSVAASLVTHAKTMLPTGQRELAWPSGSSVDGGSRQAQHERHHGRRLCSSRPSK